MAIGCMHPLEYFKQMVSGQIGHAFFIFMQNSRQSKQTSVSKNIEKIYEIEKSARNVEYSLDHFTWGPSLENIPLNNIHY